MKFLKEAGINLEMQNMIQRLFIFVQLLHITTNCLILTAKLKDSADNWLVEASIEDSGMFF